MQSVEWGWEQLWGPDARKANSKGTLEKQRIMNHAVH